MSKSLYDRLAETDAGSRALAAARLRYESLSAIHRAIAETGVTQTELARRLGIRKSAVNQVLHGDGNLKTTTLAEYLHVLGFEVSLELVAAGTPRLRAMSEHELASDLEAAEREAAQGEFMMGSAQFESRPIQESDEDPEGEDLGWTPFSAMTSPPKERC